jgi:hypothetical protein
MYAARRRDGGSRLELTELEEIGRKLKTALDLASKSPEDSIGYRAARSHAEDAASRLMALISLDMRLAPTVEAAVIRMRRREPFVGASERRKTATKMRG